MSWASSLLSSSIPVLVAWPFLALSGLSLACLFQLWGWGLDCLGERRQRVSSSSLLHGEQVAKGMHAGHLVLGALVPQLVLLWPTSHLPGLEAMCSRLCIANGQVQIQSACSLACSLGMGSDLCDLVIFRSHTLCGCCKEARRCGREAFRGKHRAEAALDRR